jgi:hypothetical protein
LTREAATVALAAHAALPVGALVPELVETLVIPTEEAGMGYLRRSVRVVVMVTVALTWTAEAALAQTDSVRLERLQAQVNSQDKLRAFTYSWDSVELRSPRLTGLSITYDHVEMAVPPRDTAQPFPRPLPLTQVSQLQVRGSAAKSGAIIGGSVLGGLGLAAGLASTKECSAFELVCGSDAGDVVVVTLGSAAVGALLGAVIGSPFKTWKTIYRAP